MIDLTFDNVSKQYIVRREQHAGPAAHSWLRRLRATRIRKETFWALRDVSFAVSRGETLGIIGHNGAGKSTILKLLAGITTPTSGRIEINGRLSALIEVGSGFHPELTGRENIFLNGTLLGMSRQEIASKLDSIVEFAGVRPFLDVPVKRFSSGMYVRLGFSIAAHLDPDILLLDEVLAVGDAAFQEKCLRRIRDLREAGTTIVFISHDLAAVDAICERVILLDRGEIAAVGRPKDVIEEYQRHVKITSPAVDTHSSIGDATQVTSTLRFQAKDGAASDRFGTGLPLVAQLDLTLDRPLSDVVVDVLLYTADRAAVCELSTESGGPPLALPQGNSTISFTCDELAALPGLYYADVAVRIRGAFDAVHRHYQAAMLRVHSGKVTRGAFYQPNHWQLISRDPARAGATDSNDGSLSLREPRDSPDPIATR